MIMDSSEKFNMIGGDRPSESFSDEDADADAMTIDYDEMMDSSRGTSRPDAAAKRASTTEDKPMIGQQIPNTSRWKIMVVVLMLVNTSVVVLSTSLYLSHDEDQEFQRAFDTTANTVISAAHFHAEAVAHSVEILSDAVTSYSQDSGSYLPYVTIPRFEQRVAPIRESSGILELAGFLPLVTTVQREFWETYVVQQQGWIQESYSELMPEMHQNVENDPMAQNFSYASEAQHEYSVSEKISIAVGREYIVNPGSGPYAPLWQLSPPPPPSHTAIINTDLMSSFTFQALFDSLINGDSSTGFVISHPLPLSLYPANEVDQNNTRPSSACDQTKSVLFHAIRNSHGTDGEVKGFAMGVLDWERFFSKLLPANVKGVDCVLHNPCDGQSHTFRIQSNGCTLLDNSDMYDGTHNNNHRVILTGFTIHASDAEILADASVCNYEIYIHAGPLDSIS